MPQNYFEYTREKLVSVKAQITELLASDFPYPETEEALTSVETVFSKELARLRSLPSDASPQVKQAACVNANLKIKKFVPLLGFILRSTNIRNSFELIDPLIRLSRTIIKRDINFILSSEWDFSPLTYSLSFPELPDVILLGLPSFESGNALVVPLAGHELGHWIWRDENVETKIRNTLQSNVLTAYKARWQGYEKIFGDNDVNKIETDLFIRQVWTVSFADAMRQCEEIFADFVGLKLFGQSYLDSFEYLLAPFTGEARSREYPDMRARAELLQQAAARFGFSAPPKYAERFADALHVSGEADQFMVEASDAASQKTVPEITSFVEHLSEELHFPTISSDDISRCVDRIRLGIPADHVKNLASVISAGWIAYKDETVIPQNMLKDRRRIDVLNELLLKSIEVSEFEARMRGE